MIVSRGDSVAVARPVNFPVDHQSVDFFPSNGADKPKQKKVKPWYRTSVGLLLILIFLVATIALIFSIIDLYHIRLLPR